MNKTISFFISGLVLGILAATAGFTYYVNQQRQADRGAALGGNANRQIVLKLAHSLDTNHPVHQAIVEMKKRLEELSGGMVILDIYSGGVLGGESECIEQLQSGSLAMTKTSAATLESFTELMSVFSLPYIFRDKEHMWKVLDGAVGGRLLLSGEAKRLRGLCYYDAGSRNFYTKSTSVKAPDDLKGLKIRTMKSKTAVDTVQAMGASPIPIDWGELYTALGQGTVDGAENNILSFYSNNHFEICKHFTLDGHSRIPDVLLVSTEVWKSLPPHVQGWVQKAADESSKFQRELWDSQTRAARAACEEKGVHFYEVDNQAFAEKVAPMLERVESPKVRALLREIREVQ